MYLSDVACLQDPGKGSLKPWPEDSFSSSSLLWISANGKALLIGSSS